MFKFDNPMDPTKDGNNLFIDGIRFHIRNSAILKYDIQNYIKNNYIANPFNSKLKFLEKVMQELNIDSDELTIADEHELLDWIYANY